MPVRKASAVWHGTLKEGHGHLSTESGVLNDIRYTWAARFADEKGTNPEEIVGAAHAACYTMFLSALLTNNKFTINSLNTEASVELVTGEGGPTIKSITLNVEGSVADIDETRFAELAAEAKAKCPVSKALAAVETITLNAKLVN